LGSAIVPAESPVLPPRVGFFFQTNQRYVGFRPHTASQHSHPKTRGTHKKKVESLVKGIQPFFIHIQ
ncbi:hypothetical protein J0810_29625, partial [Bacillus paranthracis]|uniref:hypothetical protein n=1 Tax=Bacillus paranthracis TaxID=2026186 RepID=UPI002FDC1799